jgi:serine/threonine protein kinase
VKLSAYGGILELSEANIIIEADEWEVKRSDLENLGHLGQGQFGDVYLAFLKNTTSTYKVRSYIDRMQIQGVAMSTARTVAVKLAKGDILHGEKIKFLQEIQLLKKVSHGNMHIVEMIGCIVSESPWAMVMEYVPFGDLHSNLVYWKKQLQLHVDAEDIPKSLLYLKEGLKDEDLLSFARQISIGMSYLASENVVHRDLACRNVLVGYGKILKIADFGLSKEIDGLYVSSTNTRLPVRWMAPEAITQRLFSEKSDVWSYGICLWELCTLGDLPYGYISNQDVTKAIAALELLDKPERCSNELYELMLKCWRGNHEHRPTFTELKHSLDLLLESSLQHLPYFNVIAAPPDDLEA